MPCIGIFLRLNNLLGDVMVRTISSGLVLACTCLVWTPPALADVVTDWNAITLRCVQAPPPIGNRGGPVGLMDIAVVQAAVHDAVQSIEGRYEAYRYTTPGSGSVNAAVAAATYGVLVGLYGADDPCLVGVANPAVTYAGDNGVFSGNGAAAAILPEYRPVFVSPIDPFIGGTGPGEWRPTPGFTAGTNTFMAFTQPFTLKDARQFRPQPMPPLVSNVYAREYEEVKSVGSINSTTRTAAQTDLARFWTANPIATWYGALRGIASAHVTNVGDSARLFALASMAAADAQMTIYESKYHFNFWRPITAIREGDNDGNRDTVGDPDWVPFLGLTGTPPYPEYSSGANCLASSILTTVELILGTGDVSFAIASSVAGLTTNPRQYVRLSDALDDIVDVRIYQGIHFRSADEQGRRQGARVAHWAYEQFLRPLRGTR
jgi:hypothetical protein